MVAAEDTPRLAAYGLLVNEAMAEVAKAERDFADSDWFDGASVTKIITLADGSKWAVTVGRPDAEQSA
jgi:hypothetical protein